MISLQTTSTNLLLQILDRSLADATVSFRYRGQERTVGQAAPGCDGEPDFVVEVRDPSFFTRVISEGNLGMAETYMDGGWVLRAGSLEDFLTALLRNRIDRKVRGDLKLGLKVLGIRLANWVRGGVKNVQAH